MITYDINLCIGLDNQGKQAVVKCHDTGVNLRVHLFVCRRKTWRVEEEPYLIPDGATAILKVSKPDKTKAIVGGEIQDGNILFKHRPEVFTAAGISSAEVSLYDIDGNRLTTASFEIDVPEECICDCEKESEPYVDIMAEQIGAAIEAEKNAKGHAESAGDAARRAEEAATRAENAVSSGGGSGVSVSIDGKTLILEDGVMRVNTTNEVEQDNTQPITSAAVYTTVGNISAILDTI